MRIKSSWAIVAIGVFGSIRIGDAGPSFNSDRAELAGLSRDAGAALQRGLANMHLMLEALELGKPEQAQERRADALKDFNAAIVDFEQISEKAPNQKLVLEPRSDVEKQAAESLGPALKRRNMPVPGTEKELAQLAVKVVTDFRSAVAESPRFDKSSSRAFGYFQKLFREEGFLLNVGINASVIWSMQVQDRR